MNEKCSICFSRVIRSWRWHERFSAIIVSLSKEPLRFACKLKHLCMMAHNCHGKTKHLTAKPNTSQQKQNRFGFTVGISFCREVFGFCCEVFGFVVRSFVLPWGILFLPWGFRFCSEVFGFAVTVVGHRIYEIKTKIFWLKEYRVFCTEKYNSAPSYLRDS